MNEWSRKDYPTPESSPEVKQESPEAPSSLSPPASFNSHSPSSPLESALVGYSNGLQIKSETQPKRTTPCQQCRRIRRACKWIEGDEDCERCGKLGKQCTGPTRRSKSTIELVRPAQQQQLKTVVAAIGPSSPETRWSTLHMSYSLTYHLFDTALEFFSNGIVFVELDYQDFVARFRTAKGRCEDLSPVDELFLQSQLIVGAHCSTHSALLRVAGDLPELEDLVGPRVSSPDLTAIGLARRQPLSNLLDELLACIERQLSTLFDSSQDASERLSITLFAMKFLVDSAELDTERLRLLRLGVQRGLEFLQGASGNGKPDGTILSSLRDFVSEELRLSLLLGQHTNISPGSYHLLLGNESMPPIPTGLNDISFVFDVKNEHPSTLETTTFFFQTWTHSFFPVHRHLEYTLAYATRSTVASAIAYCWGRLDAVYNVYNRTIRQISEDSRYDQFRYQSRPTGTVATLILDMADLSRFECSCYRKVSQYAEADHLLQLSQDRLFRMLNQLSDRLALLYRVSNEPHQLHSAGVTFVENIRSCPEEILRDWASLFSVASNCMIDGLRLVSYGMPDACRLIQILEIRATSTPS